MTRRTQYSIASLSGLKHLLNMPTCFLYWILVNSESIGFDIIISSICHQNSEFQRKAKFWLCWNIVESRIACSKWVLNFFFFATLVFWWRGLCVLCCGGGGDIHYGSISIKLFLRPLKFLTKYFMMDWGNTWNKEEEVGLFFVWLQRLLMTEFNTTFPTVLCIFPSLLQFIPPPSEKASTFTSQKICSHFYFVPSPISASFFSSWPSPSFRPQLKPLWRHCGVVNCGIEKVRPLTEKHFFLIMENSMHKSRVDYILVIMVTQL